MSEIADYVKGHYPPHQAAAFLDGADPWIIAHAMAYGGTVVTFESRAPKSNKPKIPDVADHFGVVSTDLWKLLRQLRVSFGLRETNK